MYLVEEVWKQQNKYRILINHLEFNTKIPESTQTTHSRN